MAAKIAEAPELLPLRPPVDSDADGRFVSRMPVTVNHFNAARSVRTPHCKLFGHGTARAAKRSSLSVAHVIVGNGIASRFAVRPHDDRASAVPEKNFVSRTKAVSTHVIVNDCIGHGSAIASRIILPSRVSP